MYMSMCMSVVHNTYVVRVLMYISICDHAYVYVYMTVCMCTYTCPHIHECEEVAVSACVRYVCTNVGYLGSRAMASLDPGPHESPPHR